MRGGLGLLAVTLICGACQAPPAHRWHPLPSPEQLAAAVTWDNFDRFAVADAIAWETNRIRREARLRPLRPDGGLSMAVDLHAGTLALLGQASHDNPLAGQATPFERAKSAGAQPRRVAENVAISPLRREAQEGRSTVPPAYPTHQELARQVVQQWLDSPGHRANLLNPDFTHFACGAALARSLGGQELVFAVQLFMVPATRQSGGL